MKDYKQQKLTSRDVDEIAAEVADLKGRITAYGRPNKIAGIAAIMTILFLTLHFLICALFYVSSRTVLQEVTSIPVWGAAVSLVFVFFSVLPQKWYIILPASLAAIYLSACIVCYVLRIFLRIVCRPVPANLKLSKDNEIEKVKELYYITREEMRIDDGSDNDEIVSTVAGVIAGGLIGIPVLASAFLSESVDTLGELAGGIIGGVILGALVGFVVWGLSVRFSLMNLSRLLKEGRPLKHEAEKAYELSDSLHMYWMSIDPAEKKREEERLAAEEKKRQEQEEKKRQKQREDALLRLEVEDYMRRHSESSSTASSGLTASDDLDYLERAMKITAKYGSDWKGYDPEAPDPDIDGDVW